MKKSSNPLRALRIALACAFLLGITLLIVDATTVRPYLGWMAKLQFWPSILGVTLLSTSLILLLTLAVGRIYCSVICPLGVLQDLFIRLGNAKWLKKAGKHFGANRFRPSEEMKVLRFTLLALFIVLSCFPITAVYAHFLEPYSLFGKAVAAVTSSYYSWAAYGVVAALFLLVMGMALLRGRLWCNTLCPVGTTLSIFSRFAVIRPVIDAE
ncbi:MAG: 4Fe-4S binding protein, partial [Bacteroidales bacterium]|nr:4Fe-4S binding protein [Candidatus Colicola faecequi]